MKVINSACYCCLLLSLGDSEVHTMRQRSVQNAKKEHGNEWLMTSFFTAVPQLMQRLMFGYATDETEECS